MTSRSPRQRGGRVEVALLAADKEELERISRDGVLSLTLEEMRAIQEHFRGLDREPSACELETLAQTWSEHCKHKTFAGIIDYEEQGRPKERIDNLLKSTIVRATDELARPWCVSVFKDNAGIIAFDRGWDVCIKVETHNHPSAIDPYGGAGTGIGGVIRDVLGAGLGAKPIANTDCFFVGPLDLPRESIPKGTLHPRRILRGVVAGVRDYGNRMGIPTVNGGDLLRRKRYIANPLVFMRLHGRAPDPRATASTRKCEARRSESSSPGRTDRARRHSRRDVLFGRVAPTSTPTTFSGSAVQIGNADRRRKSVLDALLHRPRRSRTAASTAAVTDCGAGVDFRQRRRRNGRRSAARTSNVSDVPLKYARTLATTKSGSSEAQERMVYGRAAGKPR